VAPDFAGCMETAQTPPMGGRMYDPASQTYNGPAYPASQTHIYLPYEGFNARKWPNTYKTLLLLYHLPDWHRGKWVNWGYPQNVGGK
jgi:hypothetical protein